MKRFTLTTLMVCAAALPALATEVIPVPVVPEPGALALFAAGAAAVAIGFRLRRKR